MSSLARARSALAQTGLTSRARPVALLARPTGPPSHRLGLGELLGPAAALRLPAALPRLATAPRGDGHVVIDLPGWRAPEATAWGLRTYLRWLGYDARSWGLGTNGGSPERDTDRVATRVLAIAEEQGPVSLVGWSLGGVIAREVARREPEAVRRVVTYGSPVVGGPRYTALARAYPRRELERITRQGRALDRDRPVRVPVTAVLSRRDGVVAWQACVDHASPRVDHVEVGSTHLGLGLDPDVWLTVARRLAD
ncbi:hypothetical protein SAMN04488570_3518 [Nocardioides scoriae]|uniref:Alpha/beta hydrolase family protein n=1 Tax=Nocardioides scoriae TaxID=642780 RepID=A0A1H1XKR5_9ACTN|nr:alpha/beta hydrolase [Nocardioides scoriae]SDT09772.1 hypothetical protein SAMN04488570_3518 [Nocardioides scoriae]